eukprot:7016537-Pyramimonas_sp.AAC.1
MPVRLPWPRPSHHGRWPQDQVEQVRAALLHPGRGAGAQVSGWAIGRLQQNDIPSWSLAVAELADQIAGPQQVAGRNTTGQGENLAVVWSTLGM